MSKFPFSIRAAEEKSIFATLAAARGKKPLRIARPIITTHLALRDNRNYLRSLRAAEMAAWQLAGAQ